MDIKQLKHALIDIETQARQAVEAASTLEQLRRVRPRFLGRKGSLGQLMATIRDYPPEQRGLAGQTLNAASQAVTRLFADHQKRIESSEVAAEASRADAFDASLPGVRPPLGNVHPVTAVQWEIEHVFQRLGFTVEAGPEMESEYYNFEALNIPAMHPARDLQDTFWLSNGMLLRTHTSPVQVRTMEKFGPPIRCIVPGRCFRYETVDASHETTFHQCEGLVVDRNISIANLIAVMRLLLREVFKRDVKIRLRPGYFPFVEPGFELDMSCLICGGSGCPTCKKSGWVEILPCGMVHPNVLRYGGIDPHEYTGFAFGLGLTRLAMMKYGVSDIRVMNSGDVRALVPPSRLAGSMIVEKQ
ncbi:MAG: phenylalanine--tRNA ligase subunit alpha [Phycisphaerales bacterium]|nr:MAG: phenylalanine--tRNA ligase subunit alpha [Phycisphaerales bacterium]